MTLAKVLTPGTKVRNPDDPSDPMTGVVIATPSDRQQSEPDDFIWVEWANGLVCMEYHEDVAEIV